MSGLVHCKTCGVGYTAIFEESDQANGCAADVHGNLLKGSYGSATIDMEIWEFKGDRPENVKEGVICDTCITGLMESGQIVEKERGVW